MTAVYADIQLYRLLEYIIGKEYVYGKNYKDFKYTNEYLSDKTEETKQFISRLIDKYNLLSDSEFVDKVFPKEFEKEQCHN